GSSKRYIPRSAVPVVPMPVQTAYAVPTERLRSASPSRPRLMSIAKTVNNVGTVRVKPSVNFSPMAQPVSKNPAIIKMAHAIIASPLGGSSPQVLPGWREVILSRRRDSVAVLLRQGVGVDTWLGPDCNS